MLRLVASALVSLAALPACGGFRPVGSDGGGDLAAPLVSADGAMGLGDLATSVDLTGGGDLAKGGAGQGPGPAGALPSGYCCQSDAECRHRRCLLLNGAKQCADACVGDETCQGNFPGLRCVPAKNGVPAHCEPAAPNFVCRKAADFRYGAKKNGACCTATHDGSAGLECEGGLCVAFGDPSNPYICTRPCEKPADCPGSYFCGPAGDGYSFCVLSAAKYTCN